jgi:tetratricopeptide (TPR) repeat protein
MMKRSYKPAAIVLLVMITAACAGTRPAQTPAPGGNGQPVQQTDNPYFYFTEAQMQIKRGHLDQAVEYLEKAIEKDPTSLYLQKELAMVYLQMKQDDKALSLLEDLRKRAPQDADILTLYGRLMQKSRDPEAARGAYLEVLEIDPDRENIYLLLGGLYIQDDRLEDAQKTFERLVQHFPDSYAGHLFLGKILLETGDDARAETHLENALELDPDMLEPRFELLRLYRARAEGIREITVQKGDSVAAISLRLYGKYNADIEQAILRINPGMRSVNTIREGQVLRFPGIGIAKDNESVRQLHTKIINQYREILNERPRNVRAALELADYYLRNGFEDEAASLLKELGARSVSDNEVLATAARLYLDEKNYEAAAPILEGMLAGAPDSSALHNAAGITYYGLKEYSRAISHFRQVAEDSRFYADAVIYTAFLYQESDRPEEAIRFLETAVDRSPDQADFIYYLAVFQEEAGRLAETQALLKRGIANHPGNAKLHFRLGVVSDKMGDKAACIAEMKRVIELDPKHANALNYLGYTYAEMGQNLDEAERLIKRALSLTPNDGYITDSLGWVYYQQGKFEKALSYLKKAVERVPDDPIILEHLGDVYRKLGDKQNALKYYRQSLENDHKERERIESKIRQVTGT